MSERGVRGLLRAAGELRGLAREVAEVPWLHPAWPALVGATALVEAFGRREIPLEELYPAYLAADGGPHTDTFMGRPRRADPEPLPRRIARAVVRARAVRRVLAQTQARLPGPPLAQHLVRDRGWLGGAPLERGAGAFLTDRGPLLAPAGADARALVTALARWCRDGSRPLGFAPVGAASGRATPAVWVASIVETPLAVARHVHRQAWTRGGGPWLGVADSPAHEVVSTCHLAVDGYGHALLAEALFAALDRVPPSELAELEDLARRELAGAPDDVPGWSWRDVEPLGIAAADLADPPPFPAAAYAFGRALERFFRAGAAARARRRERFSPSFQVPVAPGPGGYERRLRRVLHGLLAVRMHHGDFEPFEEFRERLRPCLEREVLGGGLLTRALRSALLAPLPRAVRCQLLRWPARPSRWLAPVEVLAGRGRLSSLRFAPGDRPRSPLLAASAPALRAAPGRGGGGVVLTVTHGARAGTATVAGSGLAGDARGARRFLETWSEELDALRRGDRDVPRPTDRAFPTGGLRAVVPSAAGPPAE